MIDILINFIELPHFWKGEYLLEGRDKDLLKQEEKTARIKSNSLEN